MQCRLFLISNEPTNEDKVIFNNVHTCDTTVHTHMMLTLAPPYTEHAIRRRGYDGTSNNANKLAQTNNCTTKSMSSSSNTIGFHVHIRNLLEQIFLCVIRSCYVWMCADPWGNMGDYNGTWDC